MSIPMVIRVKGYFAMSDGLRKRAQEAVEAAYNDAKERGVPLVVGEHCEVLWPVERWEHYAMQPSPRDLEQCIAEMEAEGWQVAAMATDHFLGDPAGYMVVFKRPARESDDE